MDVKQTDYLVDSDSWYDDKLRLFALIIEKNHTTSTHIELRKVCSPSSILHKFDGNNW